MNIKIKTPEEISKMHQGGRLLGDIKQKLVAAVAEGVSASEIDNLAERLIKEANAQVSFKMVEGYSWATCININDGVVHGIPKKKMVFKKGDLVSIDVGLFYKGFHTDTSTTVLIGKDKNKQKFLNVGKLALKQAISKALVGNRVYDISLAIQEVLEGANLSPIQALTGHGVGRELHEEPFIPCFVPKGANAVSKSPLLAAGMVLAIEVMYALGSHEVKTAEDGWTIVTQDGKISALFEETVAVTTSGPIVLTEPDSVDTPFSGINMQRSTND